jgi:RNA polymerase sigma-70 factor (ECF subfamily)
MAQHPGNDDHISDLVHRAQSGDTLAMAKLLDHLVPYVGRLCAPIALGSAADATQESLIMVFRRLRHLRETDALYGWVRSIAVREAVRVAQRDARTLPHDPVDLPAPGDPQLAADVADVLKRLSPNDRAILVMRDLEGLDERSAAAMLDISSSAAKSRLHRARSSFRKAWRP